MFCAMFYPLAIVACAATPYCEVQTRNSSDASLGGIPVDLCETASVSGEWQLSWDDVLGNQLEGVVKRCDLSFHSIEGQVIGSFSGPVAGRQRDAILEGRLECQPRGNLLTFQQREAGYVCSYQIFFDRHADDQSKIVGAWHDTEGRSGNFTLLKYQ